MKELGLRDYRIIEVSPSPHTSGETQSGAPEDTDRRYSRVPYTARAVLLRELERRLDVPGTAQSFGARSKTPPLFPLPSRVRWAEWAAPFLLEDGSVKGLLEIEKMSPSVE